MTLNVCKGISVIVKFVSFAVVSAVFFVFIFLQRDRPSTLQTGEATCPWLPVSNSLAKANDTHTRCFNAFFDDPAIVKFRTEYAANYSNHNEKKLLSFVLEGNNGFGSALNSAINVYVISRQPEIDRTFQINSFNWPYLPISELFVDFANDSVFPLFPKKHEHYEEETYAETRRRVKFSKNAKYPKIDLIGKSQRRLTIFNSDGWFTVRFASLHHLVLGQGMERTFTMKSEMTRALWNPVPNLKEVLLKLYSVLRNQSGGYIAIHIRRGDKITRREMGDIAVGDYWKKLREICASQSCPSNVFLMYDEQASYDTMRELSSVHFQMLDLRLILQQAGETASNYVSEELENTGTSATGARNRDGTFMREHSKELVLSISLLAMSDHLICTFSSNVCRLAAVLRGNHSDHFVHSLDYPKWNPL
ncbi:hypothetical protein BV898_00538 [Hypsibius exemplaris]|uniref:Alpha-(1,6)-fucosyltransferase N- and catalytic domain-containing protein n=1 Tax=Hypsibius exemplaris TaxID=2072580 RepID=A0A1W0XE10_HYPEX|nr:hypothetical protein BV898_00538 [Hypsibius exemplaris]